MRRLSVLLFTLAVAALFLGPARLDRPLGWVLSTASDSAATRADGFRPLGVYGSTDPRPLPLGVATRGSWLDSDEFQGTSETPWYHARRHFTVMVAGYPALAPNRLELELRRRDGTHATLPFTQPNPGEAWHAWSIELPADAQTFRIRAVDASSDAFGWLAFSEPFVDISLLPQTLLPLLQLAATTALALVLIYGPGLLWLRGRETTPHALLLALALGPLVVAALGLACWLLGGWLVPSTIARLGIAALLLALAARAWRTRRTALALPSHTGPVLLASALLIGFAVAKANLSFGPKGELFHDTVSRTLAVGGHSDSRLSYHVVQLVAGHHGPFSPAAESLYSPWSFANRGPLGGLIAAPIVLATGGQPTLDATHQPWRPFDAQGFAAYRISQIVLASLAACAAFATAAALLPVPWPLFTAITLLLTPFFVHELYFTWPKLPTAAFVLAAFTFAHARRPALAAAMLALAYFFHPLALFSAPFLALWLLRPTQNPKLSRAQRQSGSSRRESGAAFPAQTQNHPLNSERQTPNSKLPALHALLRRFLPPALFGATLVPFVAAWMFLGRLAPLRNGSQTVFFDYFKLASGTLPATAADWWHARWNNLANTFLPFHLFTVDPAHESINSVYHASDAFVRTSFLYWNTLPFALGVPAFLLLTAAFFAGCRRAFLVAFVTFLGPALLMIVYWGAADTGLLRHCGHVLFVSFLLFSVWSLHAHARHWRESATAAFLHPLCLTWRAAEILLVAFGTTLLHRRPDLAGPYGYNDLVSLLAALACLVAAVVLLAKHIHAARAALFQPLPHAPAGAQSRCAQSS